MQDLITFLIKPLLEQPDVLVVESSPAGMKIKIAKSDMGRVIGKHGVIISSLRNLVRTYSMVTRQPFVNLVLEEAGSL